MMHLPIGVAEYYAGKSVFITGATGFMGIVLVEKLLRSCPDVKTLYLLIRAKKGLSVEERLQKYINNEVFQRVQAESPKQFNKIQLIPGDLLEDNFGMSISDKEELVRECNIIFHCAASVRFDMIIRDAVEINVVCTQKLLDLAQTMKKLEVFLHMSTAYCYDYLDVLEEKLYPAMHCPQDVMRLVKWMDDDLLKTIEKKLIHPLPNTYTYTKNISEGLVAQYAGKFTIAIARPSIVVAAHEEPFPGWINNMNGPTGLAVAGAKGILRTINVSEDVRPDVMSVDIAVSASILLAYTTGVEQPKAIRVCNITNSGRNTKSWVESAEVAWAHIRKYPLTVCLWYPTVTFHESRVLYQIHALLVHWLPALLIDMLLIIFRRKPFMIKVQRKLHHGLELLRHYMTGEWNFKNEYFFSMRDRISEKERKIFFTEYETVDSHQYLVNNLMGIRKYCCKESPETLPRARRQLKILYAIHIIFNLILIWGFLKIAHNFVMKLL